MLFSALPPTPTKTPPLPRSRRKGQPLAAMLTAAKETAPDPAQYVPAAMLAAAQEKNAALAAKVKELEGNGALAALTAEIDAALADGRLPKSCEAWAKATAKTHPDAVKAISRLPFSHRRSDVHPNRGTLPPERRMSPP